MWRFESIGAYLTSRTDVDDSREFVIKSTCFCIQSYRCAFGKSSMGMISKNIILLRMEVVSFDEGNRIVIHHVLENREPFCKVYQKVSSDTFRGFPLNKKRP